jgi:hypothetical protein
MSTQLLLEILRQPRLLLNYPRGVWALIGVVCIGLLSFGLYLQHVVGLEPCPMCIVQRYVMVLLAIIALPSPVPVDFHTRVGRTGRVASCVHA